jgi:hypothetical protein
VAALAAQAAARQPRRWTVEDTVTVSVDGSHVWDPDEESTVPAVVVRMPPHMARHLASVLDDWTTIAQMLESGRAADERDLASALNAAARAADAQRIVPPGTQQHG